MADGLDVMLGGGLGLGLPLKALIVAVIGGALVPTTILFAFRAR